MTVALKKVMGVSRASVKKLQGRSIFEREFSTNPLSSDANLKLYYKLENTNDSSGNGYNLTNVGSVAFSSAKFNNGAIIPATKDHYLVSPARSDYYSGAFSVGFWLKQKGAPSDYGYVTKAHASDATFNWAFQNGLDSPSYIPFFVYNTASGSIQTASYLMTLNTWTHFFGVFDNNSRVRLYINGALFSAPTNVLSGTLRNENCSIYLGCWNASRATAYGCSNADIDEFMFFNRQLTDAEIQSIYYSTKKFSGVSNV